MFSFKEITIIVSVICTLNIGTSYSATPLKNFCYFTNWSHYRAAPAKFQISDINATLCTHLLYAFANIDTTNLSPKPYEPDDQIGDIADRKGRYFEFNNLKNDHPHLVTLLSVGGASAKSAGFKAVVQSENTMRQFTQNVIKYLRDRDFDGVDLDWEWPGAAYKDKFSQLLKIMWDEFVAEAADTNRPRLLITIAVGVGETTINDSYDIPNISQHVDYILVMTYDFHGSWSQVTSFTAPLFSRISNPQFNNKLSQAWAMDRWISEAPKSKLVMGLTGSATSFTLADESENGVGSPISGPGRAGPYIQARGRTAYNEACEMFDQNEPIISRWDDEQKMKYAVFGDQWVGYGDTRSMREKVKFAYSRDIAGMMFWSLDLDDFNNKFCSEAGSGKYPLLTAIYDSIQEYQPTTTTTTTTTATTTSGDTSSCPDNSSISKSLLLFVIILYSCFI